MQHQDGTFNGVGGTPIYWQKWSATSPAKATVVIAHGAGEHGGRYGYVVDHLVPLGYDVYAIDHRGHGKSGGKRAVIDRLDNAVADLDTVIGMPTGPVYLLGHSLGGAIATAYALKHQHKLAGLCLSGPVLSLEAASAVLKLISKVLSAVAPALPIIGVGPEAISTDPAEVKRYVEDPLVLHGKVPVRTVAEVAAAIETYPARVPSLTLPILLQHGELDSLSPVAGSRMMHEKAGSTDKTLHVYDGLFHEIFNEKPASRAEVLKDLGDWLDKRAESVR